MLFSVIPTDIFADEGPEFLAEDVSTAVNPTGETTVVVPVMVKNNPGFAGLEMIFTAPDGWQVKTEDDPYSSDDIVYIDYRAMTDSGVKNSVMGTTDRFGSYVAPPAWIGSIHYQGDPAQSYLAVSATNDITDDGYICWVTYVLPENIMNGNYTVSITARYVNTATETGTNIASQFTCIPGTITITGGAEPVATTLEVTPATNTAAVPTKAAVKAGNPTTVQMSAVVKNQIDGVMEGQTVNWDIQGSPAGVSIDDSGRVTVDNTAENGEITVVAKCGSVEGSCKLTLTKETSAVTAIEASDKSVNVPTQGQPDSTVELTAKVFDQYGVEMQGQEIAWSLEGVPVGVTLNENILTIAKNAPAGSVTVTATCSGKSDTALVTISKDVARPETVVIQKGSESVTSDSITIPQSGSNAVPYTAVVYDQYGAEMENPEVTWTLTGAGAGVSQTDGTVTVTPDAAAGKCTLEATCGGKTAQVEISVAGITFEVSAEVGNERVYGMTWGQIITKVSGTAVVGETKIDGTFSVLHAETVPDAGVQSYSIVFNGEGYENITARTGLVTILPKSVSITGITARNKTYDGSANADFNVSEAHIEGIVGDDSLIVASATGTFADENVGTDKDVHISEICLGGADAANYTVGSESQNTTVASITAKEITVSGIAAQDREYDGSTTVVLAYSDVTFAGLVEGDTLTVASATGAFEDKNAGDDKPVSISEIILGGEDADNYTVSQPADVTATISPKNVTITGAVAANKTYDGSTAATVTDPGTVKGVIPGDIVTVQAGAAQFASADVGEGIRVTFSGFTLTGADAGNYVLSAQPADGVADITKATYSGEAVAANVKVMTQQAEALAGSLTASDFFTAAPTGAVIIKVEGAANEIMGSVTVVEGKIAYVSKTNLQTVNETATYVVTISTQNYRDIEANLTFTAVDKTPVTVSGITVADKTYDGIAAACTGSPVVETADGETVSVSGYIYTWKDSDGNLLTSAPQNAGTYTLTVAVEDARYAGSVTVDFTIAPKALTITGVGAADKIYDGTTAATATGSAVLSGVAGEDDVTVVPGTAAFTDENAGTQTVTFTGYGIEGADADNYTVSQPADVTATISRAPVTITGVVVSDKTYDGSTAATVTNAGTVEGVVLGDIVTAQAGAAQFTSADAGENITVVFSDFIITGEDAGNYILSGQPVNGQADITKANYSGTPLVNINVLINQEIATQGSLTVSDFFVTVPAGAEIKAVTSESASDNIMASVTAAGGKISYTSNVGLTTADLKDTYRVTISTKNYNDILATLTFTTVDKSPVIVSGVAVADKTYDGKALTYTGTPVAKTADGETVAVSGFTYTWTDSDGKILTAAPKDAGTYALTVAVEDDQYTGSVTLNCTISKATVTITALDVSAAVGSKIPTFPYRVAGLAEGESLKTEPILTCAADMNKAGVYAIKASGAEVPEGGNYHDTITYVDGKLTVYYYNTANRVTVYGGAHGIARVDDYNPATGHRVTITVTPDEGYEVDQVLVTTASGKKVPVTRTGENRYVFEMPSGSVSIQVTYKAEEKVAYTDVSPYAWYAEAVEYVTVQGLMNGVGEGRFAPSATVTRAMVWTVLARMDGENTEGGSAWYSKARTWAMENGISDGTNPEAAITREQLATMLYRYCGSPAVSGSLSGYADGSSVSDWAEDAMLWAIEQGLIEGIGGNKLAPAADTTRAQLAQILMRFDKKF